MPEKFIGNTFDIVELKSKVVVPLKLIAPDVVEVPLIVPHDVYVIVPVEWLNPFNTRFPVQFIVIGLLHTWPPQSKVLEEDPLIINAVVPAVVVVELELPVFNEKLLVPVIENPLIVNVTPPEFGLVLKVELIARFPAIVTVITPRKFRGTVIVTPFGVNVEVALTIKVAPPAKDIPVPNVTFPETVKLEVKVMVCV